MNEAHSIKKNNTIKCDICKRDFEDLIEKQEFFTIKKTGSYGSIFGDGASIECNICQNCIKEKLGAYVRLNNDPAKP